MSSNGTSGAESLLQTHEVESHRPSVKQRALGILIVLFIAITWLLHVGPLPEIYNLTFENSANAQLRFSSSALHLPDDVMIQLRAGQILLETGAPAFNKTDVAQPSTSLLAPYLAALLLILLPENISVASFALVGLVGLLVTLATVIWFSRSTINGVVLALALAMTSTAAMYAFGGWDHLLQAAFLVIATGIITLPATRARNLAIASSFLGLSFIQRPDGLLIAIGLLVAALITGPISVRKLAYLILPFAGVVGLALAVNYQQFGTLAPTTARLKYGAAPSADFALEYLLRYGILEYSALTLLVMLVALTVLVNGLIPKSKFVPIVLVTVLTAIQAAINSDNFGSARMYWTSAAVLSCALATALPPLITSGINKRFGEVRTSCETATAKSLGVISARLLVGALLGLIVLQVGVLSYRQLMSATLTSDSTILTRTAEHYLLSEWIAKNLKPEDGALGLFWAGASFHLPSFEIADFLGKGDELIASSEVKWGAPGHNKWDINKTLAKWRPQAIIPSSQENPTTVSRQALAQEVLAQESDWAFDSDLVVNKSVQSSYTWCEIEIPNQRSIPRVGLLIRNDINRQLDAARTCFAWPAMGSANAS